MNKIIISFILVIFVLSSYELGKMQGVKEKSEQINKKAEELFDAWIHQESPYTKTEIKNLIS